MPIQFSGYQDYNGFLLSELFTHTGNLMVLTGRNGSGKTRLLEGLKKGTSIAEIDGVRLSTEEIMLVPQSAISPRFGGAYNNDQYQTKITSSMQLFDRVKTELDAPLDIQKARNSGRMPENSLPYVSLYKLCNSIGRYLNKPASELTHEEIKIHFEDDIQSVLGFQNISSICNNYIKRKKLNRFNRYLAEHEDEDVPFLTDKEFLHRFGEKPWLLLNDIIKSTFDGKFYFSEPDEKSESYSYNATLIQQDTDSSVTVNALSSGENTLLWLALTLFNSQYYDKTLVSTPKLLLLDEPDAFLHPKMVMKMYQTLESFSINFQSKILITTHSPTTVALAPEKSTYILNGSKIIEVGKDEGVAELLDGITQISISPENRRQVFVESKYDADVYQIIYSKLLRFSPCLDPKISLSFISSGPKMPNQQIKDKAKQILRIEDDQKLEEFAAALNGVGNCAQVIGHVEALENSENKTVRGIIDWDRKRSSNRNISVLAEGYAYSIENVTLDPICILLLLHTHYPESFTMDHICGSNIYWSDWLKDDVLLQVSIDRYIEKVFGRENKKDAKLEYISGKTLLTDSEYLLFEGHPLEELIKEKYRSLKGFARSGKNGELKYTIVSNSMINMTNGKFIPSVFEKVLLRTQN